MKGGAELRPARSKNSKETQRIEAKDRNEQMDIGTRTIQSAGRAERGNDCPGRRWRRRHSMRKEVNLVRVEAVHVEWEASA